MSRERLNQVIDVAYEHYRNHFLGYDDVPTKDVFVFECKTNKEFSERWGLKIEERELTLRERKNYGIDVLGYEGLLDYGITQNDDDEILDFLDYWKVSTKLITVTYQNETIQVYE